MRALVILRETEECDVDRDRAVGDTKCRCSRRDYKSMELTIRKKRPICVGEIVPL